MRVAVYGGTFDPPHNAHLALAEAALRLVAERVIFVLSADPPHKALAGVTPYVQRRKMLELALRGEPRYELSDIELERLPRPSYTIDTMEELSAAKPSDSFVLLLGSDSLAALHTWMRAKDLVSRYEIAVYPREGQVPTLEDLRANWPDDLATKLHSSLLEGLPQSDLSSTRLRSALANSENAGRFIPKAVLDYIASEGLYSGARFENSHENTENPHDGSLA